MKWIKKDKLYWIGVSITACLCFAFTLLNYSVGVDDEAFKRYFYSGDLVAQGRWATYALRQFVDTYEFIPFWRDFIALILIVLGFSVWENIFQRKSKGNFDNRSSMIFTCMAISCAYIGSLFIFMSASIEIGLVVLLTGVAIDIFTEVLDSHRSKGLLIVSLVALAFAIATNETAAVYFLMGSFMILFVEMYYEEDQTVIPFMSLLKCTIKYVTFLFLAVITSKFIGLLFQKIISVPNTNYTNTYITYTQEGFIRQFLQTLYRMWAEYIFDPSIYKMGCYLLIIVLIIKITEKKVNNKKYEMWFKYITIGIGLLPFLLFMGKRQNDYTLFYLKSSFLFFIVISFAKTYTKKNIYIVIYSLAIIVSTLSMIVITGNLYLPKRVLLTFSLFLGFVASLGYTEFKDKSIGKFDFKYIMYIIITIMILNQSKQMNKLFFTDYLRYKLDLEKMHSIARDISKKNNGLLNDSPVVFLGIPESYNLNRGDVEGISIFEWDRIFSTDAESSSSRLYSFFNMHGYNIRNYEYQDDVIREQVSDMPIWPQDGYVKKFDEYTLVKIGTPLYEKHSDSKETFLNKYNRNLELATINVDYISDDNNILAIQGWGIVNDDISKRTNIKVALIGNDKQYVCRTMRYSRGDLTGVIEGIQPENEVGYKILGFDLNKLEKGDYSSYLLIEEGNKSQLVDIGYKISVR